MRSERIPRLAVIGVFALMLALGLWLVGDYGVSTDEPTERLSDIISYNEINRRLLGRTPPVFAAEAETYVLAEYADRYYGVAMRMPIIAAEDLYYTATGAAMDKQAIYFMRHLYVWLIYFVALIAFYRTLCRMFRSRGLALTGVLMLFLFGRFFAQSFYDVKDMLFVSLVLLNLASAQRVFASGRKPGPCLLFALTSALAVTSRLAAAVLDVLMIALFCARDVRALRAGRRLGRREALSYLCVCCALPLWLLLTPASWAAPLRFCLEEVETFKSFETWHGEVFFGGRSLRINMGESGNNPWDYTLRWIVLTVPLTVLLLGALGGCAFLLRRFGHWEGSEDEATVDTLWLAGLLLAGTLCYQLLTRPVLYDSWRHSYFLYPLIALFAVYALWRAGMLRGKLGWLRRAAWLCMAGSLLYNGVMIARIHPFEMMSMNPIGQRVAMQYQGDFWGLSGKQALEWVLANDDREDLKIYGLPINSGPGLFLPSIEGLPTEGRARLRLAFLQYAPDYLVFTQRDAEIPEGYAPVQRFTIYGDDVVCAIYKREGATSAQP